VVLLNEIGFMEECILGKDLTMTSNALKWKLFVGLLVVCVGFALSAGSTAQTSTRQLFNGKNLDGWQQVGPGSFVVVDGLLKTEGGMGMLWYTGQKFENVTIHVVFKQSTKEADSGVFIRIPEKPTEPWMPINRGYEVEIGECPSPYSCTGGLYTFSKVEKDAVKPAGEWNSMDITIDGPHTVVVLNGTKVTDYKEGQPVPARHGSGGEPKEGSRQNGGYIGLQNHPGSEVFFKEISVTPLK
jgi:hypothetical protein